MKYLRHILRPLTVLGSSLVALLPLSALAQIPSGTQTGSSQTTFNGSNAGALLTSIITFIDTYVIPLIFAIAFVLILFGIFRYFIAGGANEEKRKEGQQFLMWSILALAIMISVWGLVNLLVNSFGFANQTKPCLPGFNTPCAGSTSGTGSTGTQTPTPPSGGGSTLTCKSYSDCPFNQECVSGTCKSTQTTAPSGGTTQSPTAPPSDQFPGATGVYNI